MSAWIWGRTTSCCRDVPRFWRWISSRSRIANSRFALARTRMSFLKASDPAPWDGLGLGPDHIHAMNPSAVYARITGYGQDGPNAPLPGHDINYIAETGALYCIGSASVPPPPPLSLVGDFGGGGMYAAFSIAAAVREASQTGRGRVLTFPCKTARRC